MAWVLLPALVKETASSASSLEIFTVVNLLKLISSKIKGIVYVYEQKCIPSSI